MKLPCAVLGALALLGCGSSSPTGAARDAAPSADQGTPSSPDANTGPDAATTSPDAATTSPDAETPGPDAAEPDGTPDSSAADAAPAAGGMCEAPACGGAVVGQWTMTGFCTRVATMPNCPGFARDDSGVQQTGTLNFSADGTYNASWSYEGGSAKFVVPLSCLTSGAMAATSCAMLQQKLAARIQGATCSGTDVCTCLAEVLPGDTESQGQYSIAGSTLTITALAAQPMTYPFCVSGTSFSYTFPWDPQQAVFGEQVQETDTYANQ